MIIDTAGRLTIDDALMDEIRAINAAVKPVETLLVVDAMTGQEAVTVAQGFAGAVPVTGLVLTKIDGDARGGAALSIGAVTGIPVKFLGTGEKTDALEVFHPDRLAGRILGMGDIVTLTERAQEAFDEKQAAKLEESVRKGAFTLEDMLASMRQMQKMGPMGQVMSMIPGHGRHGQGGPGRRRPRGPQARRGDHPVHDAARAAGARRAQRVAPATDRERLRDVTPGRQSTDQAVR